MRIQQEEAPQRHRETLSALKSPSLYMGLISASGDETKKRQPDCRTCFSVTPDEAKEIKMQNSFIAFSRGV